MKKLFAAILALVTVFSLALSSPALAEGNTANGATIFSNKCASCHSGGGNIINGAKTLKQDKLVENGKNTAAAIIAQVTNGNGAMPGFKSQLTPQNIEDVAAYVLEQAAKDWK